MPIGHQDHPTSERCTISSGLCEKGYVKIIKNMQFVREKHNYVKTLKMFTN